MNKKYFVIAIKWCEEAQAQKKVIVGSFDEYYLANIFREAYNASFSAHATIVNSDDLLNV